LAGRPLLVQLDDGWTRIGRSGTADIQLDDPTVSRRHALLVRTPGDELRALDDRSLNGLFVNGDKVDWAELADGDELEIGRYRLYVLEV
jgi:pSer/pThr/pTyr-binding forkhead associated (FHA) protein